MNAKAIVFEILGKLQPGDRISGYTLANAVNARTGRLHYPDTMLRHLREYRKLTGRQIVNVSKPKSIYEVRS